MIILIMKTYSLLFLLFGFFYLYEYFKKRTKVHITTIIIYLLLGFAFFIIRKINNSLAMNVLFGSLLFPTIIIEIYRIIKNVIKIDS